MSLLELLETLGTMAMMLGIAAIMFVVVIPIGCWAYDKYVAWYRHYKRQKALVAAVYKAFNDPERWAKTMVLYNEPYDESRYFGTIQEIFSESK